MKMAKFRYVKKFWGFKMVIVFTKLLHKLLILLAKNNHISGYGDLGSEARVSIWKNFITVVLAFLLLMCSRHLYTIDEYNSVVPYKAQCKEDGEDAKGFQINEGKEDENEMKEEEENKRSEVC